MSHEHVGGVYCEDCALRMANSAWVWGFVSGVACTFIACVAALSQ